MMKIHKIIDVKPLAGHRIQLTYSDGTRFINSFEETIQIGGIFRSLEDEEFFRSVKLGARGRSIEWPGGIDFCADALRLSGKMLDSNRIPKDSRQTIRLAN